MHLRFIIAGALLVSSEAALACRCRVADTLEKRAAYADSIRAFSQVVALGRFHPTARDGRRRFLVRERLAGASKRKLWVLENRPGGPSGQFIYSGSCVGVVDPWTETDKIIVLRRRPEDADYAPAYEADSCATTFLEGEPVDRMKRGSRAR